METHHLEGILNHSHETKEREAKGGHQLQDGVLLLVSDRAAFLGMAVPRVAARSNTTHQVLSKVQHLAIKPGLSR